MAVAKVKVTKKEIITKPAVKEVPKAETAPKTSGLSLTVFGLDGKAAGSITLPKEIFGQPINKTLIAHAVRVYQTNMGTHTAHTKTRGEVNGGGAKPWRQKGTGNARAGSRRSPIWVGGGRVFAPRFRDVKMSLPTKMKHAALVSALSAKAKDHEIKIVSGFEKATSKTKVIAQMVKNLELSGTTLIVIPAKNENLKLATRNIQNIKTDIATNLNALSVLTYKNLVLSKEAVEKIK
ncbi:50S ribosomal protein L4 [Candidatus Curtissbacteria bacterium]|nr:50S ribosomal protein L4 [Candidatus Curtissbacteria bacterium]